MSWINRLLDLVHGRRLNRSLDEELSFHIEARTQANIAAGMAPKEARQDAMRRFGNLTLIKESTRDSDILKPFENAGQDLRYAIRSLRKSSGFAVTAILSLALGIGASTAIFSITDSLLLRPLPYRDPSRLMMLWEAKPKSGLDYNVVSPGNYLDWKAQNTVFENMAAFTERTSVLTYGDHSEELGKQSMSAELLPMLGIKPIRGRLFTPEEDSAAIHSDSVLIISYRVWQSWFGGAENVIGQHVEVNSMPRTIIGVLPRDFYFRNREIDLWEPLGLNPAENYRQTSGRWILAVGRLKPGATRAQAQAQMTALSRRLAISYPEFDTGWTVTVEPLRGSLVRNVQRSLLILLAAVGLLLAVACANVANLLLARFTTRRQEIAVRASLGAGRWRIIRQVLTESLILAILGGLLGAVLARWAVAGLLTLAPKDLTQSARVFIDTRIFLFSVALSVLTGIIFGLGPSLITSQMRLANALSDGSRSTSSSGSLRRWLVTAEVALSVMLLAGAGLLFRSMVRLQGVDPGLNASGVLTFRVSIPAAHYREVERRQHFFNQVLEGIDRLPGVRSASAVSYLPLKGIGAGTTVTIASRPKPKPGEEPSAVIYSVMPGYFHTLEIPLDRGRDFNAADNSPTAPYRFIVNRAFVRKYFADEDPLGKSISVEMDRQNPFGQIVGVVGDVRVESLAETPEPTVYYIYSHLPYPAMNFVVRSNTSPMALVGPVRNMIHEIDPAQPIAEIDTMEQILGQTFARQRFSAFLLTSFSLAALLLAAVGIYGVLAYTVSERNREIGVRVAMGAEPGQIISLVLRSGLRLVISGLLIGVAGSLALSGLLRSLLFGVGSHDPLTFITAPALFICVALIAACLPALRAARLDPTEALRAQ